MQCPRCKDVPFERYRMITLIEGADWSVLAHGFSLGGFAQELYHIFWCRACNLRACKITTNASRK